MGIHVIKMPDIGEGIAEVELVEWHVEPGAVVIEDQTLADVMTDKATVEIPSPVAGRVLALGGRVGDVLAVGAELIQLEVDGAGNVSAAAAAAGVTAAPAVASPLPPATPPTPRSIAAREEPRVAPSPASAAPALRDERAAAPRARARVPGEKPLASPAVRREAWDLGIELQYVPGSGPAGRIMHEDLATFAERGEGPPPLRSAGSRHTARDDETAVPVIGLRRKIAQRMQESKRRIPHFTYVEEIDVTELEALRVRLNGTWGETRGRLTILPFLMRAIVLAVPSFPQVNARYDDDAGVVTRYGGVHVGIATQTDGGLMVPVVRHAEARDLWANAAEVARLADAARSGKATREELSGSTITITSLGPLGGIVTTPVINHPEVAIVGVNRIVARPMIRDGTVVARQMMNLSSSFDHRVVDGADAARFVQALRGYLECPALLFVE